MRSFYKMIYAI